MAESLTILNECRKRLSKHNLDCLTTNDERISEIDDFVARLHELIDCYQLFDSFTIELVDNVAFYVIEEKACSSDTVYRYVDDAFLLIPPNAEINKTIEVTATLTESVHSDSCIYEGDNITFNLSAGPVSVIRKDMVCKLMDQTNKSMSHVKALDRKYDSGKCILKQIR